MSYSDRTYELRRGGGRDGGRSGPGAGARARAVSRARLIRLPVLLALVVWLGGCGYGRIHELDEDVAAAQSEIEVQLQRRVELVPGLIETVTAYGAVSEEVVAAVAEARLRLAGAVRSGDLTAMEAADAELCRSLDGLLAVAAANRGLRSDPAFELLRSQLKETKAETLKASRRYNVAVRHYNDYIAGFPQLLTARVIGAERRQLFEPSDGPAGMPSGDE
jgi:LemA protein